MEKLEIEMTMKAKVSNQLIIILMCLAVFCPSVHANSDIPKEIKQEAKRLKKEGWQIKGESQSIEMSLYEFQKFEIQRDKYLTSTATSKARSYDKAHSQAMDITRRNIAAQISAKVESEQEQNVNNAESGDNSVTTKTKTTMVSTVSTNLRLGTPVYTLELYRVIDKDNTEVLLKAAYNK